MMQNVTGTPQFNRMGPSPDAPDTRTYLSTGDLPKNDDFRINGGAQWAVNAVSTSNLFIHADPAVTDSDGNTPLCLAAQAGNLAQLQQLIHKGADVHHINLDGDNALTLAAVGGHLTFIERLDGHCPQPVNHENYYGETALTLAARHGHQPLVQWLVSRNASVAHLNDQLKDALAEAVANGHLALAQWLSSKDADLKRVYPDGNNLFLHAVRAGHQSMAQWLEDSGVDSQQVNESGDNALTLAAHYGHRQLLAWLLEKNAAGIHQISRNGDSLLLMAARQGHIQTVKLLVQHGADTGLANYAGSNALTLAAASSEPLALWLCWKSINIHQIELSGNNAFTLAARSGYFQLMQILERLGVDIHQVNRNNDNAFTLVARQGSLRWCQWLAVKGINIHQVNCQHHNAVTLAALAGSQPLLKWLCDEKVDWQQIPRTPPYDSYRSSNMCLPYGFNAAILAACAGHFTEARWLMHRGLSIHQRDYFGRNAVIQAVRLGQLEAVQWLIAQGIIPDSFPNGFPDYFKNDQHNVMSLAASLGHLHILQWLHQNGGSLNDQDEERILLIMAARCGDLPMTQWLCRQGADINRLDSLGASALSEAVSRGHLRLSQWLVGHEGTFDINGNKALTLAAMGGHNAMFRWLIRSRRLDNRQVNDLLLHALHSGHRSLSAWLCLNVCNCICGADNENHNALMLGAKHGFLWLTQWLSEHTRDINQANHDGDTALMLAATNGHLPVVQWLYLEKNANLQQKNANQLDALHLAVINGQTETVNWLIGQGMVLNLNYFKRHPVPWISNRNNVGLLQCLLSQQLPPELLVATMIDAARNGDMPALVCGLSAGISLQPIDDNDCESCFDAAGASGLLAMLEFLCDYRGDYDVDDTKESALLAAAHHGNLHIIQWFLAHSGLSRDEKSSCLIAASISDQFHVVKWLYRQGADIGAKDDEDDSPVSIAVCSGNIPMLEWCCQQGEDLHQVEVNGEGALSLAIHAREPQVALWLLHRGCRLIKQDIRYAFSSPGESVLGMIFKMTSRIRRASLFHSFNLNRKLWLLEALQFDTKDPSEAEADARFARFNQYDDKTLEHKCMVTLANLIRQQSGTLEAALKAVDSLPLTSVCKFNLRELVIINLE